MMNVVDGKRQEPIPEFEQLLDKTGGNDKQESAQKIIDILSKCERN